MTSARVVRREAADDDTSQDHANHGGELHGLFSDHAWGIGNEYNSER